MGNQVVVVVVVVVVVGVVGVVGVVVVVVVTEQKSKLFKASFPCMLTTATLELLFQ